MAEAKPISTPMVAGTKLSKDGDNLMQDVQLYRSTVGALQYVTITRHGLSFVVNIVCQFMSKPLEEHWIAVKRILRYLKASKKQQVVARSSTKAEYRSLAHVVAEISWVQSLLIELCFSPSQPPTVFCDNQSAILISHNLVLHHKTKHVELDIHFVREKVLQNALRVVHIPAVDQVAYVLTKPLSGERFPILRRKLIVLTLDPIEFKGG